MCSASAEFAEIWAEHGIGAATSGRKAVVHAQVGELLFDYTTLTLPELPGHRLMLHTPAADTPTEQRLTGLLGGADRPMFDQHC